jgi:hypothetical protein
VRAVIAGDQVQIRVVTSPDVFDLITPTIDLGADD